MRAPHRLAALLSPLVLVLLATAGCAGSPAPVVNPTVGSTGPGGAAAPDPDPRTLAARLVATASDEDLVGQVLMPSVNLDDSTQAAMDLVRHYHLGGVIIMGAAGDDGTDPAATARTLTAAMRSVARPLPAEVPLLIGTDQEYGWVTRIKTGIVQLPSAMALGAAGQPGLTEAAWHGAGAELAAIGINIDFAPDADVLATPANAIIGSRSFGDRPDEVSAQVAAAVRGLQTAGVAATLKHFPGHGNTSTDSHTGLPVLRQDRSALTATDLPPFQAGIDAGAWAVMVGHLQVQALDADLPATFSTATVDLLRSQLGFTGLIVTDALNMAPARRWPPERAALKALTAGSDLLLMPPDLETVYTGLLTALDDGRLPRQRLVEAATRVLTLKYRLARAAIPANAVDDPAHVRAAAQVAQAAVTVLRGACQGPLLTGAVRVTATEGRHTQVAWLTAALRERGVSVVASGGHRIHLVGWGDTAADLAADAAITVAMDTPYLLSRATSPTRVATYSSTRQAMEALAAVVTGERRATGRSPVSVSGLPRSACAG